MDNDVDSKEEVVDAVDTSNKCDCLCCCCTQIIFPISVFATDIIALSQLPPQWRPRFPVVGKGGRPKVQWLTFNFKGIMKYDK